jgi:hypothetical protein
MTEDRPRPVETRFELAAARMAEGWLHARRFRVSAEELRITREFLERRGWRLREVAGLRVRVVRPDGRVDETTREDVVMTALRGLAFGEGRWHVGAPRPAVAFLAARRTRRGAGAASAPRPQAALAVSEPARSAAGASPVEWPA